PSAMISTAARWWLPACLQLETKTPPKAVLSRDLESCRAYAPAGSSRQCTMCRSSSCAPQMLTLTRKPMSTRDAVHRARLCYAPRQIARRHDSTLSAFGIDTEDRRDIIAYAAASRQRSELESQNMTGLPEPCRSQGAHRGRRQTQRRDCLNSVEPVHKLLSHRHEHLA